MIFLKKMSLARKKGSRVIVTLCLITLLLSIGYGVTAWFQAFKSKQEIEALRALKQSSESSVAAGLSQEHMDNSTMLSKFTSLYAENTDIAGWLTIDGTNIDYPVMYTPQDEDYYLDKNFHREPDDNGTLLIDDGTDPFKPATNILIHGHNMKNGNMFTSLLKYKDESYYKEHSIIRFDTLYEKGEYEIIASFYSQVYKKRDQNFKYYKFFQANTPKELEGFVDNIKQLSLYDTGVSAQYGDTFITLSTCSYHVENGRFVVVAKKVI